MPYKDPKKHSERMQQLFAERMAKGLCRCGRGKPRTGKKTCQKCADTGRKSATGFPPERYHEMKETQDGRCAICKRKPEDGVLMADHNHKTNKPRGLLCRGCNFGLGSFQDDPRLLENAIDYLHYHAKLRHDVEAA
jgi:hypothetical protein